MGIALATGLMANVLYLNYIRALIDRDEATIQTMREEMNTNKLREADALSTLNLKFLCEKNHGKLVQASFGKTTMENSEISFYGVPSCFIGKKEYTSDGERWVYYSAVKDYLE